MNWFLLIGIVIGLFLASISYMLFRFYKWNILKVKKQTAGEVYLSLASTLEKIVVRPSTTIKKELGLLVLKLRAKAKLLGVVKKNRGI